MNERNWELAVQLRGRSFQRNLETYKMLTRWVYSLQVSFNEEDVLQSGS